jgi:CRISPR system Cascade subunit CasE
VLLAFAKEQRLLHREVDEGYLAHAALAALFGARAPAPFVIEHALDPDSSHDHALGTKVLAYSSTPGEELRDLASQSQQELIRWEHWGSKPMPELAAGQKVGFATRVTPTVRSRAPAPGGPEGGRGHGREIDAFLAACFRDRDAVVDRAQVYRDWLAHQLSIPRNGAGGASPATLNDFALRRFERVRLLRKEQSPGEGRKRHVLERPDAVIAGTLQVGDASAFRALLARGLGRHRSFGFGMLLLRPIRGSS